MDTDAKLDYPRIVQDAFRDVVRRVLARVAEEGLPGEHHFYIGFRTDRPGVEMAPQLRSQYPEEMTVILQHQYWDLEVDEDAFAVSLNFNARRQRVRVPFAALTTFVDPSAEFGLRFDGGVPAGDAGDAGPTRDAAGSAEASRSTTAVAAGTAGTPGTPATDGQPAEVVDLPADRPAAATPGKRGKSGKPAKPGKPGDVVPFEPRRRK